MLKHIPPLHRRLFLFFILILLGFLTLSSLLIVSHQKNLLLAEEKKRTQLEIDLISGFISESFLKQDYAAVGQFLWDWGKKRQHIVTLAATVKNGFELTNYQRDTPSLNTITVKHRIQFQTHNYLDLQISTDLTSVETIIRQLNWQLFAISAVIITVMGFILWLTMFKIALLPLENEINKRTAELHHANHALQSERDFVSVVLDTISALVVVLDPCAKILRFNHAATQITGYSFEEVKEQDFNELFAEAEFKKMQSIFKSFGNSRPKESCETSLTVKHGFSKTIIWNCATLTNPQREIDYYVVTGVDMTRRKQAEIALRESEQRFDLAMQGANDGVWDWNFENHTLYFSPRWKQMLGFADLELQNNFEEWRKRLHPEDVDRVVENMTAYLDKRLHTYENLYRMQHREGHYIWILGRGLAIWNDQGEPTRFVGTQMDLTAQKQVELALQQAKEAAEQAKQEAEIANHAKSTFLANMSHELRTPLNGILGYAQILGRDKTLSAKHLAGVNIIQRSGEYLLTLVNDVLDISKIEANRIELYLTDFNLIEFLKDLTELFRIRAEKKGLSFIYETISALPIGIRADEKRLRQVLINLLSNAIKFTERGGVAFKVGLENTSSLPTGHQKIRFQLEDTGQGISPEELSHIFLPFRQGGDPKYRAEGTGLGLSITKKLVELMGGEIHVESLVGRGSTFWITLTFQEVSDLMTLKKPQPPTIIGFQFTPDPYQESACKILIIDDKWENRSVLVNLLTPLGFDVQEAQNGKEGVEKARLFQPHVVLTDLVMPIMDGFEATRQIRQLPGLEEVVIIANSASVFDNRDQIQSLQAGCNTFISKPIRADELLHLLQVHVGLTWIYEQPQTDLTTTAGVSFSPSPTTPPDTQETVVSQLVGPSPESAAILFDLAMRGDLHGIVKAVNQLAQENEKLVFFAEKIRQLAKNFEEEQICNLVEQYLA